MNLCLIVSKDLAYNIIGFYFLLDLRSCIPLKENIFTLILMAIVVSLSGELKFYPFHSTFQISFGVPIFFLFLLMIRKTPRVLLGLIVGLSVFGFRFTLDILTKPGFGFYHNLLFNLPTFFYYFTYALMFTLTKVNKTKIHPLWIGFLSIIIETSSSIVELTFRYFLLNDMITISIVIEVFLIAIIRSFFALGFFYAIKLHEVELKNIEQKKQNEHMILLISNLYEESMQLHKTLKQSESITRDCYNLYENLNNNDVIYDPKDLSQKLLYITGQIHEIKKDNQRIYAGLSKMIMSENYTDYISIDKISYIVVNTNKKYAESLDKQIEFILEINDSFPELHVYTILSIMNNLISNSIESIKDKGCIKLLINKFKNNVEITISDTGSGIPQKKNKLIFKPGYTTKYDISGKPSTGMGLPYVNQVVNNLNGSINLKSNKSKFKTIFTVKLPISSLIKK